MGLILFQVATNKSCRFQFRLADEPQVAIYPWVPCRSLWLPTSSPIFSFSDFLRDHGVEIDATSIWRDLSWGEKNFELSFRGDQWIDDDPCGRAACGGRWKVLDHWWKRRRSAGGNSCLALESLTCQMPLLWDPKIGGLVITETDACNM